LSAKGAALIAAWGTAPGPDSYKEGSAESAIHSGVFSAGHLLRRAFSARSRCGWNSWGDCPRL